MSEIMNHFRFASSSSVGELIVNFNNPGFFHRSKLLHWIFNPFLLSRLLLNNIVYQQKLSIFYQLVEVFLEALIQTPQTTA